MSTVILETKNLTKAFANKKVVSGVDFVVREGEITALLGENCAGKSTFKNMLVGLLEPTEGSITFDGREMKEIKMGKLPIAAVHQELSLFLNLTVAENICIEDFPGKKSMVNWKKCREEALKYMGIMNIQLDPDAIVGTLGPGEQQLIEIAKAIRLNPRVLILDEPTASLTAPERERLFEVMRTLKKQRIGMIFITHFLDEVFAVCDKVVVLRNSEKVCDAPVTEVTKHEIEEHMVGHSLEGSSFSLGKPDPEVALRVTGLESESFADINFEVHKGEILGVAGLIGAGRTELMESIFGLRKCGGTIEFMGETFKRWNTQQLIKKGMVMIPEDRKNCGIFPRRDLKENITAAQIDHFVNRRVKFFGFRREKENAQKVIDRFRVACPRHRSLHHRAQRRQPAEDHRRPVAEPFPEGLHVRRPNPGRGRGLEGGDRRVHRRACQNGHGRDPGLFRPERAGLHGAQDHRDAARPDGLRADARGLRRAPDSVDRVLTTGRRIVGRG